MTIINFSAIYLYLHSLSGKKIKLYERKVMESELVYEIESEFMEKNIDLLLKRFSLSYYRENACIEYFIDDCSTKECISASLVFAYNPSKKDVHVSRFHPELQEQSDSKYLSAACFYLIIHHLAEAYGIDNSCHISLETVPDVNDRFYSKLKDFDFHITKLGLCSEIELQSCIKRTSVDTSVISEHIFKEGEIPFLY